MKWKFPRQKIRGQVNLILYSRTKQNINKNKTQKIIIRLKGRAKRFLMGQKRKDFLDKGKNIGKRKSTEIVMPDMGTYKRSVLLEQSLRAKSQRTG